MTEFPELYSKAKTGATKSWKVWVEGDEVFTEFGLVNGKKQIASYKAVSKNPGKSNETTPEEQAILEAESKFKGQQNKRYYLSVEESNTSIVKSPMLAKNYVKVSHLAKFPCYKQNKLDGMRVLITDIEKNFVSTVSKGGLSVTLPTQIFNELLLLNQELGIKELDGEIYLHGEYLQDIMSNIRTNGSLTGKLEFHIFDIPSDKTFDKRIKDLEIVKKAITKLGLSFLKAIETSTINSEEEGIHALGVAEEDGYEGLILRNKEGLYEYGYESSDLLKWKNMESDEAFVYDVGFDKIKQGILFCKTKDGVLFDCKMVGNAEARSYENQRKFKNKWITYKYQDLSKDSVPIFPVGMCERKCDEQGNPLE